MTAYDELQLPSIDSLPSALDLHSEQEQWLAKLAQGQRPPEAIAAPDLSALADAAALQAAPPVPKACSLKELEARYAFPPVEPGRKVASVGTGSWQPPARPPAGHSDYVPIEYPKALHNGTDSQIAKDFAEELSWNGRGYR